LVELVLDDDGIGGVGMLEELWLADWQANTLRLMLLSTNNLNIVKDGFFITDCCYSKFMHTSSISRIFTNYLTFSANLVIFNGFL